MAKKRYSHDGVTIIDHLKKDLVYIEGKENLLELAEYVDKLQDENEQLKQFKEKVFTLIDKEIARNEEAIKWGKETGADSGSMGFYNHMLKRLKKELEDD